MNDEVYDKAKWHYEAKSMPDELPETAGATHIAFFIRWCIENEMMSEDYQDDFEEELQQIIDNELDCRAFFFDDMDGVFASEDLNTKGNTFAASYYQSEKSKFAKNFGNYLDDYDSWVKAKLGSEYNSETSYYYIEHTEENYIEIKDICNRRYSEFINYETNRIG